MLIFVYLCSKYSRPILFKNKKIQENLPDYCMYYSLQLRHSKQIAFDNKWKQSKQTKSKQCVAK